MEENLFEKETRKDSVFVDRNIISPHYLPEQLPFREKQIKEITELLSVSVSGKKPNNLFVYGKVGTGKTATCRHVLRHLKEYAEKQEAKVKSCYINCRTHNSKHRVLMKAAKEFYPSENFLGYSNAFVYEKLLEYAEKNKVQAIVVLDEIDKVKDLDDLVYQLTRGNDELEEGSISIIGISNNLLFKERLDARTKSSLCEKEMVFTPYNAEELKAILHNRVLMAFKKNSVKDSAVNLASAIAAQESGDARTAVMLLLRAGELADKEEKNFVTDLEVENAKNSVEQEIVFNMISTLPEQQQLLLYTISSLSSKRIRKITGKEEEGVLFSGEVYDEYSRLARKFKEKSVSTRWFRQYINELETYGLIVTTKSGPGTVGNTRLIKLGYDPIKIKESLEGQFSG